jgi:hypothetical protein
MHTFIAKRKTNDFVSDMNIEDCELLFDYRN